VLAILRRNHLLFKLAEPARAVAICLHLLGLGAAGGGGSARAREAGWGPALFSALDDCPRHTGPNGGGGPGV
jgi:hypothetical protein